MWTLPWNNCETGWVLTWLRSILHGLGNESRDLHGFCRPPYRVLGHLGSGRPLRHSRVEPALGRRHWGVTKFQKIWNFARGYFYHRAWTGHVERFRQKSWFRLYSKILLLDQYKRVIRATLGLIFFWNFFLIFFLIFVSFFNNYLSSKNGSLSMAFLINNRLFLFYEVFFNHFYVS